MKAINETVRNRAVKALNDLDRSHTATYEATQKLLTDVLKAIEDDDLARLERLLRTLARLEQMMDDWLRTVR